MGQVLVLTLTAALNPTSCPHVTMLALLEIPVLCFVVAPDWAPQAIERGKVSIGRHGRRFLTRFFAVIGAWRPCWLSSDRRARDRGS